MLIGTLNHVKVKRLKKLLDVPLYCAMGVLESLWQLCMECCDEGDVGKFSNDEIADHIEWDGDADTLINALAESGWLDTCTERRYVVHDWFTHCPKFIHKRVQTRKAREAKKSKRENLERQIRTYDLPSGDMCHNSGTCAQDEEHVASISHRIVSHRIESNSSCSEASTKPLKPAKSEKLPVGIDSHVWPHFVVSGSVASADKARWTITEGDITEWQKAFPSVDVRAECFRAHVWIKANWGKRKTYTGYPAFFVTWLSKEQNKASGQQRPTQPTFPSIQPIDPTMPIFIPQDRADRMRANAQ